MGKGTDALIEFVDEIPDEKLSGISEIPGTIYKNDNFRLDMQGASFHLLV